VERINASFEEIGRHLAAQQQETSDTVRRRLIAAGYPDEGETLSQMAVRALLSLPGLSSVLTGMRRPEYIQDLMEIPSRPSINAEKILREMRSGTSAENT